MFSVLEFHLPLSLSTDTLYPLIHTSRPRIHFFRSSSQLSNAILHLMYFEASLLLKKTASHFVPQYTPTFTLTTVRSCSSDNSWWQGSVLIALEDAMFEDMQERTCINVISQDRERLSYTDVRTSKLGQLMTETQSSKSVLFAEVYKLIRSDFVTDAGSGTEIMIPQHMMRS